LKTLSSGVTKTLLHEEISAGTVGPSLLDLVSFERNFFPTFLRDDPSADLNIASIQLCKAQPSAAPCQPFKPLLEVQDFCCIVSKLYHSSFYSDIALFSFRSSRLIVLGKFLVSLVLLQIRPPKEVSPLDLMAS
jgi:hypothetical protein